MKYYDPDHVIINRHLKIADDIWKLWNKELILPYEPSVMRYGECMAATAGHKHKF